MAILSTLSVLSNHTSTRSSHSTSQKWDSPRDLFCRFSDQPRTITTPDLPFGEAIYQKGAILFRGGPSRYGPYPCPARLSSICYVLQGRSTLLVRSSRWSCIGHLPSSVRQIHISLMHYEPVEYFLLRKADFLSFICSLTRLFTFYVSPPGSIFFLSKCSHILDLRGR